MENKYPDDFTARFLEQARLLNKTSDAERAYGHCFVENARLLGKMLHVVREYVDRACLPNSIDNATTRLWEQGLVLPYEIADGDVMAVILWYIDRLQQRYAGAVPSRLRGEIWSLYQELTVLRHEDHEWQ